MDAGMPIRRRHLITRLRALREARGLSQAEAAKEMGWERAKVLRLEGGKFKRINAADVMGLCQLYGATPEETQALAQIAKNTKRSSWWYRYTDLFPGPFLGLEAEARTIDVFEPSLIPGLFQTRAYMRSLMERSLGMTIERDELQPRIDVRVQRQHSILERQQPPAIWAILDEAVLRRQVGGAEVMREQIHHLLELTQRPTLHIQVLPFSVGAHAASGFQFTILGFGAEDSVVYIDSDQDGLYIEEPPARLLRYRLVFDRLQATAMSVEDTHALLTSLT